MPPLTHETKAPESALEQLFTLGAISEIDYHFARGLRGLVSDEPAWVYVAAALASRAVQAGHVCLDLGSFLSTPLLDKEENPVELQLPALGEWQTMLSNSRLVDDLQALGKQESEPVPLYLEAGERLYLQRYADYQQRLAAALTPRIGQAQELDSELLERGLEHFFGVAGPEPDYQRVAAALALRSRFCVISGGPGTGKTTTVAKILLLIQQQALEQQGAAARILLLAPTGKAAQRLSESIDRSLNALQAQQASAMDTELAARLWQSVPREASTIHRALGYRSRTPTQFRHNPEDPLHADVVLVDEASMVDLALMTKLLEAVAPNARLILLGDKDQLASVEAGAILGDIFNADAPHGYSAELRQFLDSVADTRVLGAEVGASARDQEPPPISDCMVQLVRSYRYAADSAIGQLARAIRSGDAVTALTALSGASGAVDPASTSLWIDTEQLDKQQLFARLSQVLVEGYEQYLAASGPEERLRALAGFRLLTPHRRGPIGSVALNALAEEVLRPRLGAMAQGGFYPGRPIIVTENDYQMELFNGDVGVIDRGPDGTRLVAHFESADGIRQVQTSRLPAHETVFVMTVHKSQGSEFDHVALVLPQQRSPVFTRELLYTGITRAKQRITLLGREDILRQGLQTRIQRASGLRSSLW